MRAEGSLPELLKFGSDSQSVTTHDSKKEDQFRLDRIFSGGQTTQDEVYEYVARPTIEDVIRGYNGTIFAYGQTGSGKTFSMFGADREAGRPDLAGIIPRSCAHIFNYIDRCTDGTEFTVKCSFLEIYKETIRDLLNPQGINLKVRETPSRGVWVEDLSEHYVQSQEQVFDLLKLGEKFRQVTATDMNQVSSRSHSLFILILHQQAPDGSTKSGRLNLADLAGSEKVGKTNAVGNTLEEAKKINQSLSALGNCIAAITKNQKHIPYRDSKLSFILRESLGGNTKTTLLVCCSPHRFNIDETVGTLRFAQRAKTIKNNAVVNQKRSIGELEAIVAKLTEEITRLSRYIARLEQELSKANPSLSLASLRQASAPKSPSPSNAQQGWVPSSPSSSPSSSSNNANSFSFATADGETVISLKVKYDRLKADLESQLGQLNEELEANAGEKQAMEAQQTLLAEQLAAEQERLAQVHQRLDASLQERNQARLELEQARLEAQKAREIAGIDARNMRALEQDNEALGRKVADLQALRQRCEALESGHAILEAERSSLKTECDLLKISVESAHAEKAHLSQTMERYQATESALLGVRSELIDCKSKIDDLEGAVALKDGQLATARASITEKDAQIESLQLRVTTESSERATLEQSLKLKSQQLERTHVELDSLKKQSQQLQSQLSVGQEQIAKLKETAGEQARSLESLDKSCREAKDKCKEMEAEMSRSATQHREVQRASRNQISSLQAQREDLEQRLQSSQKQRGESEAILKETRAELEAQQLALSQLQLEHKQLAGSKDLLALQHTQELHQKELSVETAQSRSNELQTQVAELQSRLQKNRDRVDELNRDRAALSLQISELLAQATQKTEAHQEKVDQLNANLAELQGLSLIHI